MENYFDELSKIDLTEKIDKKGKLPYLPWSHAWGELKRRFPDATYTIYENAEGWNYHTDGKTAWVKTGVTVNGIEHIEYLPIMNYNNKSIPLDDITSMDVNKTIQRSITKAIARHGIGLAVYAGEEKQVYEEEEMEKELDKKISKKEVEQIKNTLKQNQIDSVLEQLGKEKVEDLTKRDFGNIFTSLAKGAK